MRFSSRRSLAPVLFALAFLPTIFTRLSAADSDELKLLQDEIKALEQKLLVLERKQEIKDDDAAAAAKTAPKISLTDKGFSLTSADSANSIKFRGLVQLDLRNFFGDGGGGAGLYNNGFVLRRARIISEGTFAKNFNFQITPEFGGSTVALLDANIGVNLDPALQFKFGRFKPPVGLELLQSDSWTFFNERSLVSNLVPIRDLGIAANGDLLDSRLSYTVGIFNGVADGAQTTNADYDNDKEVAARLFASPFKNDVGSVVQGLSFGVGGDYGRQKGLNGKTAGYRAYGQQAFFTYLPTTIVDGTTWRLSPQLDYRNGSFGLISEYAISAINVRPSTTGAKKELQNKAWEVTAGYVLTGENSSFTGVTPATNFDLSKHTWGAFEVTARLSSLKVDDAAFPLYASRATNAQQADSWGVGLNWYLSKAIVFKFGYNQTSFDLPAGGPAIPTNAVVKQDEKSLISRFQVSF